jgi:hypothetical protein
VLCNCQLIDSFDLLSTTFITSFGNAEKDAAYGLWNWKQCAGCAISWSVDSAVWSLPSLRVKSSQWYSIQAKAKNMYQSGSTSTIILDAF